MLHTVLSHEFLLLGDWSPFQLFLVESRLLNTSAQNSTRRVPHCHHNREGLQKGIVVLTVCLQHVRNMKAMREWWGILSTLVLCVSFLPVLFPAQPRSRPWWSVLRRTTEWTRGSAGLSFPLGPLWTWMELLFSSAWQLCLLLSWTTSTSTLGRSSQFCKLLATTSFWPPDTFKLWSLC